MALKQVGGMVVIHSQKMKKFMRWLNVPDDTITKLALQVYKRKLIAQVTKHLSHQICIPRVTSSQASYMNGQTTKH